MNFLAHAAFASALFAVACALFPALFPQPVFAFLLCLLASMLPDIDHKNSRISRAANAFLLSLLFFISLFLALQSSSPANEKTPLFVFLFASGALILRFLTAALRPKHRGITHSFFFMLALCALLYFFSGTQFAAAFALGFLSHLLADNTLKLA